MITISKEISLIDFEAWSGGEITLNRIIEEDKIKELEWLIKDIFTEEPINETRLNDFLWFDSDFIYEQLGIED